MFSGRNITVAYMYKSFVAILQSTSQEEVQALQTTEDCCATYPTTSISVFWALRLNRVACTDKEKVWTVNLAPAAHWLCQIVQSPVKLTEFPEVLLAIEGWVIHMGNTREENLQQ
jgi:hypothetical protein